MTKKVAAILPADLLEFTNKGWIYTGTTVQEQRVVTWIDSSGREMTLLEREAHDKVHGPYGMKPRVYETPKPFLCEVTLFVVELPIDVEQANAAAAARLKELGDRCVTAEDAERALTTKVTELEKQILAVERDHEVMRLSRQTATAEAVNMRSVCRKLETDIGKIRTAIGEQAMQKILDEKK